MKKLASFLEKIKNLYTGIWVWALFFMVSCTNVELEKQLEKERNLRELAQQEASTLKLYLGIAIAAAIIMLVLGNIMGSKSLKDSKNKR